MSVSCVIPARMGSSRFPAKPLAKICGKEMILHTLERARAAECFENVICATDHPDIAQLAKQNGFEAIITPSFSTGSDRVAYVSALLHLDLVVNLQGDEPVASLDLLRQVAKTLSWDSESWVTAYSPLQNQDITNPNVVKVFVQGDFGVQFTRKPVLGADWFAHRGIYAYSHQALQEFTSLSPSESEKSESLEQLRILSRRPIRVVPTLEASLSVDVPADIAAVESFLLRS